MPSMPPSGPINSSSVSISSSQIGNQLQSILMADDIQPGSDPSYGLAKVIYLYHPLGQKMAEAPITMAQSQQRDVTVQGAPEEVQKAFLDEWQRCGADGHIANVHRLSRVYGLAAVVLGCVQVKSTEPLDMTKIWEQDLFFNVLDPLNTAGSLVLTQVPTAADFNKPVVVRVNGEAFHRSRYQVVMNESPVYLAYTTAAFGFVGRSVYQRALFPLKSFIRSMIADDLIATKLALLIAKQKAPGGIIDGLMEKVAGIKRAWLREAQTGQVLSIDTEEDIETLDMQNVDGAGTFSRTNILKNVATAADMPAQLLENETMVAGFGEGTEDAKNIARYVESFRQRMQPQYTWFDNVVQYRAWNPEFYKIIQRRYPETYGSKKFEEAFSDWRHAFTTEWPSLLIEPESEQIKVEQTKNESIVAVGQTYLEVVDPENQMRVLQWMADNIGTNKKLFPYDLQLDFDTLGEFLEDQQKKKEENEAKQLEALANGAVGGAPGEAKGGKQPPKAKAKNGGAPPGGNGGNVANNANGMAKKFGKFS